STRIRGAIIDSTRQRDWVGRGVRRSTREIRRAEEVFTEEEGRFPSDPELASRLGISADDLRSRRSAAASSSLLHLDYQVPGERRRVLLRGPARPRGPLARPPRGRSGPLVGSRLILGRDVAVKGAKY